MHIPVLLKESIESLKLKKGDMVVDCTTNRGGHSLQIARIIGPTGTLICVDLDKQALTEAEEFLSKNLDGESPKIFYINDNFRNLKNILAELGIANIAGAIADLGISSQELETSARGFSFQGSEPLLMTLKDKPGKADLTALTVVNTWQEENLADIIYYYGDERYARRIARQIVEARKTEKIETTQDLVSIIESAVPENYKYKAIHFATKTFQALRIAVNDELQAEKDLLETLAEVLDTKARASIITFHSGEERVLKNTIKSLNQLQLIKFPGNKKFLLPSREEVRDNPRSRSAKLRVLEKI